jgi:predicted MFS family arabinose efflux permease
VLVQAFGAATSLLADAISYIVSASLLQSMPRPRRKGPPQPSASTAVLIKEGWRYVTRHKVIGPCVTAATLVNFVCGGLIALTPVFLVRTLGTPASLVGVMIATEGLGSLAGAALTPRLASRLGSARAILYASLIGAATAILMPLATPGPGLILFALGNTGFAAGVVVLSILTRTHRQTATPPELLSRVMATVRFISWGAIPFGALAGGIAATWVGNRGAFWLVCALAFLAPLALWRSPIRRLHSLT